MYAFLKLSEALTLAVAESFGRGVGLFCVSGCAANTPLTRYDGIPLLASEVTASAIVSHMFAVNRCFLVLDSRPKSAIYTWDFFFKRGLWGGFVNAASPPESNSRFCIQPEAQMHVDLDGNIVAFPDCVVIESTRNILPWEEITASYGHINAASVCFKCVPGLLSSFFPFVVCRRS